MEENTETEYHHDPAEALGASTPDTTSTTPHFQCPECERIFTSAPALRMHHVRKHSGRGWSTAENFRGKRTGMSREERLAKRRIYNRKWRLRKGMGVRPQSLTENKGGNKGMRQKAANHVAPGNQDDRTNNPGVMFCPRCGCNIKIVAAALSFGDKQ